MLTRSFEFRAHVSRCGVAVLEYNICIMTYSLCPRRVLQRIQHQFLRNMLIFYRYILCWTPLVGCTFIVKNLEDLRDDDIGVCSICVCCQFEQFFAWRLRSISTSTCKWDMSTVTCRSCHVTFCMPLYTCRRRHAQSHSVSVDQSLQ